MFNDRASERREVLTKLQSEVARLGGNPEDAGTTAGAAHRGFVNLKSAVTGRDDKAVINEVERGEDHIKAKFEEALRDDDLSPEVRSEEHTSELQSLMRISYAVFCLKKKKTQNNA